MKDQSSDKSLEMGYNPTPTNSTDAFKKSPEPSFKEKPDFGRLSMEESEWLITCESVAKRNDHPDKYVCSRGQLLFALNKLWNDYVIPLQKEIEELRKKENN